MKISDILQNEAAWIHFTKIGQKKRRQTEKILDCEIHHFISLKKKGNFCCVKAG